MRIRIATLADLEFIEGAYEHARAFMRENGNAPSGPTDTRAALTLRKTSRADTVSS